MVPFPSAVRAEIMDKGVWIEPSQYDPAGNPITMTVPGSTTPTVGMAKLSAIPGTPYMVCAMPASNDLWVLDLDREAWKPLGTKDAGKFLRNGRLLDIYGQCVWDPHHKVFVAMRIGYGRDTTTLLLKPDFSAIKWD